jgi:haloalkane dehalogenase
MRNTDWIDRGEYPFEPHYFETPAGRIHYVDEGEGAPVVMVHGTPTWSFLYRRLIKDLSRDHRVIAVDNLGFGLSDKPEGWSYLPEEHANNLAALIGALSLKDLVLVVHDFGGPVGLSYALDRPANVKGLVLFNTWMWSLKDDPAAARASKLLGGPFGKFLYTRLNFSPRVLLKAAAGDRSKITKEVHRHYLAPFRNRRERVAPWVFARELMASGDWYERLWARRHRIKEKPTLILWGMKDRAFKEGDLGRWKSLFSNSRVVEFPEAGHFVQEEEGDESVAAVRHFLSELEQSKTSVYARF